MRVGLISGMNHLNQFDKADGDYLFSKVGSIAGWATWKRSWDRVSFDLGTIANDPHAMRLLKNYQKYAPDRNYFYKMVQTKYAQLERGEKLSSWSTQFGSTRILNDQVYLVPRVNLMTNIGLTAESANSVGSIKMVPRGLRPLYQLKNYEMDFPLKHPKYVMNDIEYCRAVDKIMRPNKFISFCRTVESVFLRLIHGDTKSVIKGLRNRIKRMTGKR